MTGDCGDGTSSSGSTWGPATSTPLHPVCQPATHGLHDVDEATATQTEVTNAQCNMLLSVCQPATHGLHGVDEATATQTEVTVQHASLCVPASNTWAAWCQ